MSSSERTWPQAAIELCILTGMFAGSHFVGRWRESVYFRNKAVESGHAEYYLDADHNRKWRWKEVGDE